MKSWIHEAIYGYPLDSILKDGPNASLVDKTRKYKVRQPLHVTLEADGPEDIAIVWSGGSREDYDCTGSR